MATFSLDTIGLPIDASFYLTPDRLEDYWYEGRGKSNMEVFQGILQEEWDRLFPGWRSCGALVAVFPIVALYASERWQTVEDLRTGKAVGEKGRYGAMVVDSLVGVLQWVRKAVFPPCGVVEAVLDMMEERKHAITHEDEWFMTPGVEADLYRILMAFIPLFEQYVDAWYGGELKGVDREALLASAEEAAKAFCLPGL